MRDAERVKRHFDRYAEDFDLLYSGKKSAVGRALDRIFRWDVARRFERTIEECGDVRGKAILDVGCGPGRFMAALAARGAAFVEGVDFAPEMIEKARRVVGTPSGEGGLAPGVGASDSAVRCRFTTGDFLAVDFDRSFDITLAIGFFDYVADPLPVLEKMRFLTRGKLIATFPKAGTWRARLRRVRLGLMGCPVRFYSEGEVADFLARTGFGRVRSEAFGQLIFISAKTEKDRGD